MNNSMNATGHAPVNAAQNYADTILPDGYDAKTLQGFFDGLIKNAPSGDRDLLQAIFSDMKGLAQTSGQSDKSGLFGKIGNRNRDEINQNLVPFLEALANNPGAFTKDVPPNLSLDQTLDFIVKNAPAPLRPLLKDTADDIKALGRRQGEEDAMQSLMAYVVNKGNDVADSATPGSAIGGVSGDSPNGVGPGNIVDNQKQKMSDTAATLSKTTDALTLVSQIIADPSKLTPANVKKLAQIVADVISDISAAGGDTHNAERIAKKIAGMGMNDGAGATGIQRSLSDLVLTLNQQLLDDAKKTGRPGATQGTPAKGAAGAPAGGAEGAAGGEAAEASEGVSFDGGVEGSSSGGSSGLSIFEIIAKALGDKMTAKLKEMKSFAEQISSVSDKPSGDKDADSAKIAALSAQLGAASQEFSLISNSFSTTIKALGEGAKAAVRYT